MAIDKINIKGGFSKILNYKYLVTIVLFLAWIIFFDENSIITHMKNKKALQELTDEKIYYQGRIKSDRQKLEDLKSGVENLEKFAREQYFMSKPDEDVFKVSGEEE